MSAGIQGIQGMHGSEAVALAARQQARAGRNGVYGMVLLVGAEVVFFLGLVWVTLWVRRSAPVWPPVDAPALDWPLLMANTAALLASGGTMLAAQRAIQRGRRRPMAGWTAVTLVLAGLFMAGQWREFVHIGGWQADGTVGATFLTLFNVLTGFHAAHVAAGALLLCLVLFRAARGHFDAHNHVFVTAAALFWYLVAAVWLVLLAALVVV